MKSTAQVIKSMLTENTGIHMLDSGGDSGRHWQRNQKRDFAHEPQIKCEFEIHKWKEAPPCIHMHATLSTFHWMCEALEYDPILQTSFDAWIEENNYYSNMEGMEAFADEFSFCAHSLFNTYNEGEYWNLDQVLQVQPFSEKGEYGPTHWLVQVHNGCDVRGGYTDVKCFRLNGYDLPDTYLHKLYGIVPPCAGLPEGAHITWSWGDPGFNDVDIYDRWSSNDLPWETPGNELTDSPFELPAYEVGQEVPQDLDYWLVLEDKANLYLKSRLEGFPEAGIKLEVTK